MLGERWGLGVADADVNGRAGVLGATSFVGTCLLPLLTEAGWQVTAFSRRTVGRPGDVEWRQIAPSPQNGEEVTPHWVCVAPIWVLPDYFGLLETRGARRVVVLSSTSRFTKNDSTDPEERAIALRLADAEARVREWAESRGVE